MVISERVASIDFALSATISTPCENILLPSNQRGQPGFRRSDPVTMCCCSVNAAVRQTIIDIHEQKLPKRRFRSCPRVVRRITIRNTNVKHAHHKIIKYDAAPEIYVFNRPAA